MGITARNFAALLILINLFSWHRLLLVLGDRSLSILSSFLGFLTLFLPGFSSGNWKQKKLSPPFSPSVWEFVCWCILETHCPGRFFSHNFRGARVAQWWERSPPTNVARVQIPASTPCVGWVCCWFSPLLREVFLRVLRFSPLLKNQHFQIPIRSGTHGHV